MSLKGVYKYLYIDSTSYHIWDNQTGGDDYWFYRKQIDKLNIVGAFIIFGVKHVDGHFFIDFNIGPGYLYLHHNLIVAGEGYDIAYSNISNVNPSRKESFSKQHFTMNFSLNIGVAF